MSSYPYILFFFLFFFLSFFMTFFFLPFFSFFLSLGHNGTTTTRRCRCRAQVSVTWNSTAPSTSVSRLTTSLNQSTRAATGTYIFHYFHLPKGIFRLLLLHPASPLLFLLLSQGESSRDAEPGGQGVGQESHLAEDQGSVHCRRGWRKDLHYGIVPTRGSSAGRGYRHSHSWAKVC